jgi:hypothetical protein
MSPGNDAETARLRGQRWAVLAARPRAQAPVAEGVAPGLREIARPESRQERHPPERATRDGVTTPGRVPPRGGAGCMHHQGQLRPHGIRLTKPRHPWPTSSFRPPRRHHPTCPRPARTFGRPHRYTLRAVTPSGPKKGETLIRLDPLAGPRAPPDGGVVPRAGSIAIGVTPDARCPMMNACCASSRRER